MEDPFLIQHGHAAELFLVRHADAIPGADEIIPSGIYDDLPLSRIGREQAQALADRLMGDQLASGSKGRPIRAIYSSPLRRCLETVAPLEERLGIAPMVVEDLKEVRLGEIRRLPEDSHDLEALTRALQERQIDIVTVAGSAGHFDAIPGSEPSKEFRRRVVEAMDEIARRHIGERVLVFAHGGVINVYVAEVLELEKDFFFPAANTSITVVRSTGRDRVLFVLNDIAHVRRHG